VIGFKKYTEVYDPVTEQFVRQREASYLKASSCVVLAR
jgi:hypothetical protein